MDWASLAVALLSGIALIVAAGVAYFFNKNLKLREEQNQDKKKAYEALIKTLDESRQGVKIEDIRERMNTHAREMVYYGSSSVLKAMGDLQQHFYEMNRRGVTDVAEDPESMMGIKLTGELMLQIRKDLGNLRWRDRIPFRKKAERWHDALRITTTDMDSYVAPKYGTRRGRKFIWPVLRVGGKRVDHIFKRVDSQSKSTKTSVK